jgi:hypothetical protein
VILEIYSFALEHERERALEEISKYRVREKI